MDFKKDLSNVAAEVAKIMEAELSAKQKKIAQMSEPEHKIDAGDLAKLRAGHKPVKEETITEDDLPITTKKPKTVTVKHKTSGKELNVVDTPSVREKYKTMGYHPMKEEAEQLDEISTKLLAKAASAASDPDAERNYDKYHDPQKFADHAAKRKDAKSAAAVQGAADAKGHYPRPGHTFGTDKLSSRTPTRVTAAGKANKQDISALKNKMKNEEFEQVEEGIEDKIEAARKKAKAAGKKVEEPKKPAAPAKRKIEGKAYGGAKQKEEMEESVLPFTSMLEAYTEHGLKAFVNEQVEEEIQEEVDYLEEAKDDKIDLTHAFKQHGLHYHMTDYYINSGARKGRSVKSHEEAMKRIHKKVSDDHGPKVAEDMHKHSQSMANSWYRGDDAPKSAAALRAKHNVKWDGDIDKVDDKPDPKFHKEEVDNETYTKEVEDQKASMEGKKKQPKVAAAATQGVKNMDEEVEQIEERMLSEPETKKKEEYVKGMKKKLSGFKQRYGERAKEVMYATATKMAKKD